MNNERRVVVVPEGVSTVKHPWLVVDTAKNNPPNKPVGCWTQEGARGLARTMSLSWWPHRYIAQTREDYENG
jgi:hypothetical protein